MQLSCKSQVNNRPVPLTLSDYIVFFFWGGGGGGLTSWRYRQRHTAYLNGIMNVLCHVLRSRLRRAVVRGIVEFTHAFSLLHWSYIDWHTVWLHEALHTTASLIGYLYWSNHVTLQRFSFYRFLKDYDAIVLWRHNCKTNKRTIKTKQLGQKYLRLFYMQ